MLSVSPKNCVCSSCFTRSYELYDARNLIGERKTESIRTTSLGHPTPEEIEQARMMWMRYLETKAKQNKKTVQRIRRQRKMANQPEEETEVVKKISCSEVFLESPTSADGRVAVKDLKSDNFWDFVYQSEWKGRIRVCEGELMYKITETFKKLASERMIGNFNVTRLFTAEIKENEFREDGIPVHKVRKQELSKFVS